MSGKDFRATIQDRQALAELVADRLRGLQDEIDRLRPGSREYTDMVESIDLHMDLLARLGRALAKRAQEVER